MFIFVRLIPNMSDDRRNNRVRKSAAGKKIAQFFAKLVPFQTLKSGCPFLGCVIREGFVVHTFNCRGYDLMIESFLAKFHSHQPPAARAKSTSVIHPRTSKLIIVCKPILSP